MADKISVWETPRELWRGWKSTETFAGGRVVSIHIAPRSGEGMVAVAEAHAVPDRGLRGDRFFRRSWSALGRPDKALTLVEWETIAAAEAELDARLAPGDIRRNIVTQGVPLVELLDREFSIGGVTLRGVRLFEPCMHMERLVGLAGVCQAFLHRSGLKAAIVTEGKIRVGDAVSLSRPATAGAAV